MLENVLPLVSKPARYINTEIHSVHKDPATVRTKVCFFFPDTYEVGMSHLGIRILYSILNERTDTLCERVFSPWTDYEAQLRSAGKPLTSLESDIPLSAFDIVGVTLQYELSYSNILAGLELGGIPVRAADRDNTSPIVIAGGPCAMNPEPLSDFIDVFFIGEAENAIHEMIELHQSCSSRHRFLEVLSKTEGFYVPMFGKKTVQKRFIQNLDAAPFPLKPILPLMKPIHDRVTVEVARGCIHGCRFCQAGMIYRPYRERGAESIKTLLASSIRCTGYDELSLASLSAGDYSSMQTLLPDLIRYYKDQRVSVSLPSLRVGTLTPEMIKAIASTRKTGFTLAPEAGTERLRGVMNKPVNDQDLLDAAQTVFANGWNVLKLYFMIGLPTETQADLDGIIHLANELLAVGKRSTKRPVQLNISVSTFVPKPHTPFQWCAQASLEEIREKQSYLARGLKKRGITIKSHDPEMSLLEAAFSRGDRRIGQFLLEAVKKGCRFDGWTEQFDFQKWSQSFRDCGIAIASYSSRTFNLEDELPWDYVESGVSPEFLKQEFQRALKEEITPNCRTACAQCGVGCTDRDAMTSEGTSGVSGTDATDPMTTSRVTGHESAVRIRCKYSKTGRIRFLSHLDSMTVFQRAAARAEIPVLFSQGFNPHPKISFGPALSVGMESEAEYLDMEVEPFIDIQKLPELLNAVLPEGIRILEARVVSLKAPSLSGSIGQYVYEVTIPDLYALGREDRLKHFLALPAIIISREGKEKDIRPGIKSVALKGQGNTLIIILQDFGTIKPRVQDVIEQLFVLEKEQVLAFKIKRIGLFCWQQNEWMSPMPV
ncbi:MAG: TIGR03936 family radical SAM-associated protein [Nitrospirota bacterium]